jgi:hypothetical protein
VADTWNSLPQNVKEAGNAGQFMHRYRLHAGGRVAPTNGRRD